MVQSLPALSLTTFLSPSSPSRFSARVVSAGLLNASPPSKYLRLTSALLRSLSALLSALRAASRSIAATLGPGAGSRRKASAALGRSSLGRDANGRLSSMSPPGARAALGERVAVGDRARLRGVAEAVVPSTGRRGAWQGPRAAAAAAARAVAFRRGREPGGAAGATFFTVGRFSLARATVGDSRAAPRLVLDVLRRDRCRGAWL